MATRTLSCLLLAIGFTSIISVRGDDDKQTQDTEMKNLRDSLSQYETSELSQFAINADGSQSLLNGLEGGSIRRLSADEAVLGPHNWKDGYSEDKAKRALDFAFAAYCNKAHLKAWDCEPYCETITNFIDVKVFNVDPIQAFVGYDETEGKEQIVVSFRGTESMSTWKVDLTVGFHEHEHPDVTGSKVHKGFLDAWQSLKPSMMSYIETLMDKYPGKPILVTGHSLGAALATLAAVDIAKMAKEKGHKAKVHLYNFGSPRVGDAKFVDYLMKVIGETDGSIYRIISKGDPVTEVPPKWMGFHHTGTAVMYSTDTENNVCNGAGEGDPECEFHIPHVMAHLRYLGAPMKQCDGESPLKLK